MAVDLLTPFTKVELKPQKVGRRRGVGIFWGAFNPVHIAHLTIADQVRQQLHLEEVRFLPEKADAHVLEMLELATAGKTGLRIDRSRTTEKTDITKTIKALKEAQPEVDFYFILGGDMIAGLPRWENIDELLQLVTFVGVQRPRYRSGTSYPIVWVDLPLMDLSSTQIREEFAKGLTPNFLLVPKVLAYIKKEGLYV
jgi:nicotinate-nucleotide adenylyltransferase